MTTKFAKYDAAEILHTEEDQLEYLKAICEDGSPSEVIRALGTIARARNMTELAEKAGMSRKGLYKALSGESSPEYATVVKIAEALGLKISFSMNSHAA